MKSRVWMEMLAAGNLALCGGAAQAQEHGFILETQAPPPVRMTQSPPADAGVDAFTEERIELLGFGGMRGGKVVTGAPFIATAATETTQTLADGNHIVRKTQSSLFRDSQGRFRRETSLPALGPLAATAPARSMTEIRDPVAGTGYILEPQEKIARKMGHPPGAMFKGPGGPGGMDRREAIFRKMGGGDSASVKKEDVGTQVMNGVSVQGTRITRTIAAGEIGNEKPMTIVSETWYSNDLQMVVRSKRSDPRFGETTYTLTNLQRTEPDASLFTVPSDYTIQEGGPMMRFKGHHGPIPPGAPAPDSED